MKSIRSLSMAVALLVGVTASDNLAAQSAAKVLTVDQALVQLDNLVGKQITVKGVCSHLCSHGQRKMFLKDMQSEKTLRFETSAKLGPFKKETIRKVVVATGVVAETRMDKAYLDAWETREKASASKDGEDGHCASEKKANNELNSNTVFDRINNFRKQLAERQVKEGKAYLSFYFIAQTSECSVVAE